jgi:hypothetical protein
VQLTNLPIKNCQNIVNSCKNHFLLPYY